MESILEELNEGVVIVDNQPGNLLRRLHDFVEDMLDVEGLKTLVCESAEQALPEMRQAILNGVAEWSKVPLADDVSLVIVEVR
jgi:hypothetical protein